MEIWYRCTFPLFGFVSLWRSFSCLLHTWKRYHFIAKFFFPYAFVKYIAAFCQNLWNHVLHSCNSPFLWCPQALLFDTTLVFLLSGTAVAPDSVSHLQATMEDKALIMMKIIHLQIMHTYNSFNFQMKPITLSNPDTGEKKNK